MSGVCGTVCVGVKGGRMKNCKEDGVREGTLRVGSRLSAGSGRALLPTRTKLPPGTACMK